MLLFTIKAMMPELFCIVSSHLSDKEKISFTSCSKIFYNYKSLLKFNSTYNLSKIYDKWCVSNIKFMRIDKFVESNFFEEKFKEIIRNNIPESIILDKNLIRLISPKTKITLQINKDLTKKLISLECEIIALIILLKNNNSIENMINVLIKSVRKGYLEIVRLLINIDEVKNECCLIVVKTLTYLATLNVYIEIKKLLEDKFGQILIENSSLKNYDNELFKKFYVKVQYNRSFRIIYFIGATKTAVR